jgi:predicted transcriptional regulator
MSEMLTINISPKVLSEIEPLQAETHQSVESIVNVAITEYLRQWKKRKLREQLAKQYDELTTMWDELAEDLAAERWLMVENEALLKIERTLAD